MMSALIETFLWALATVTVAIFILMALVGFRR
jgi:hypothetical protein